MKALIVYYSFTGNTRKVSQLLARELDADIDEITCRAYTYGFLGGLRQAWDAMTGGAPPIEIPEAANADCDVVIVAGPTWAARPGTPIRSFVRRWQPKGRKLALFLTCDGTSEKFPGEKALAEIIREAPVSPVASRLFKRADIENEDLPKQVSAFADEIRRGGAG
jgi:flavodoxin